MSEPPADLAWQKPGHAVLAQIFAKLNAATAAAQVGEESNTSDELVSWARGFVGEELIAAELSLLGPEWRVIHSVPVGERGSDIDHLLIGPAGLFAVNSKRLSGGLDVKGRAMFTGGQFKSYGDNSVLEASRATQALGSWLLPGVTARPLIVVIDGRVRIREPHPTVAVVSAGQLGYWLRMQRVVLPETEVDRLHTAARNSSVWAPAMPVAAAPDWVSDYARRLGAGMAVREPATRAPTAVRAPKGKKSRVVGLLASLAFLALVLVAFVNFIPKALSRSLQVALPSPTPSASTTDFVASRSLPQEVPGTPCKPAKAQGRASGTTALLLCMKSGSTLTWQYANPWMRLPQSSKGVRCTVKGSHARPYLGSTPLVCAAEGGKLIWKEDAGWRPS